MRRSSVPAPERGAFLLKVAAGLRERREKFARAESLDTGKRMVESRIDKSGRVLTSTLVKSQPPFDASALDTLRTWTFRPAEGPDVPATTYAYLLFVFRAPGVGAGSPGVGGLNPTFQPAK